LIRWGLGDRFELRIGIPDYVVIRSPGDDISAWSDLSIGAKWQLGASSSPWDFALIAEIDVPTSTFDDAASRIDPGLIFVTGRELGERWSFGAQVGISREHLDEAGETWHIDFYSATAVLGLAVGERFGTFFEVAAEKPDLSLPTTSDAEDAFAQFHHGWTYAVSPTFQLDVHGAVALNDAGPDWLIGTGLAKRW
jgi:hypothetical protein